VCDLAIHVYTRHVPVEPSSLARSLPSEGLAFELPLEMENPLGARIIPEKSFTLRLAQGALGQLHAQTDQRAAEPLPDGDVGQPMAGQPVAGPATGRGEKIPLVLLGELLHLQ
jgi:hypothetical protein